MSEFLQYGDAVAHLIEHRYGIRVITRDVPDPLIGDLNGAEIHIDFAVSPEERLFLLVHLFGHTVQWNVDPQLAELGRARHPPVPEDLIPELMDYERAAAGYGLSLLRSVGATGMDQWLSDYTACDIAYLRHYYRTGEKKPLGEFFHQRTPLLTPRPIPAFHPMRFKSRSQGVVI